MAQPPSAAAPDPPAPLPATAAQTTAEHPWPVRLLSLKISEYVARMSTLWVEGQVVQLVRRPGTRTAYLTLRDTDVDMSLSVTAPVQVLDRLGAPLTDGAHVVVQARPEFWTKRGTLQLTAYQVRPVGVGELLARLEHLKRVLASEGLLAASRKVPLPFLPAVVGLVCGRASAAERDVVENARRRWPAVRFAIREVPVQGAQAVPAVVEALRELDADPAVEVIVVARGGGSLEDLLPFSNETLVRAAAACRTPLVSAIGHEVDTPLLDLVADLRASTPTDAAKHVVPDVAEEVARVEQARGRARAALVHRLAREQAALDALRARPVLADPVRLVTGRAEEVERLRARARQCLRGRLERDAESVAHLRAAVRALSPAATLARGYAVVQDAAGAVVRDADAVTADADLRVRLARGELSARVTGVRVPLDAAALPTMPGPGAAAAEATDAAEPPESAPGSAPAGGVRLMRRHPS